MRTFALLLLLALPAWAEDKPAESATPTAAPQEATAPSRRAEALAKAEPGQTSQAQASVNFLEQIKPIFERRCFECHGPQKQKNGLRLDRKADAMRGGDEGKPVILPGKSDESPLIHRVTTKDEDEIMPPKGERLSQEEISLLKKWIDAGAPWPDDGSGEQPPHWAYLKPTRPEMPAVKKTEWPRNGLDYFVLHRLEKEGLNPSPEEDKASLLRRASLDLTGLPPTVEEVDAFLNDHSDQAYAKAVARLLESPHYGEQWARPWLDLARYADSHGYEKDPGRKIWLYRDWVIEALNQNMPFDEFTLWQLAGDMLPNAGTKHKIASGFHRNTMFNTEGGVDKEESRVETIVDRVNTTATIWLGTTLACAQCHTHKYDPFTLKEFYQFFAFFNNVDEPELDVPTPQQAIRKERNRQDLDRLEAIMKKQTPELEAAQASWEYELAKEAVHWQPLEPAGLLSAGGASLAKQSDQSVLASGPNPANDYYTIVAHTDSTNISGLRLEVMPDESMPKKGLGRHSNGSFVLSKIEVKAAPRNTPKKAERVAFNKAGADYTQKDHNVENLIDEKSGPGWAVDAGKDNFRIERYAVFGTEKPVSYEGGATLTITLKNDSSFPDANLGRFRLSITTNARPVTPVLLPAATLKILSVAPRERAEKQKEELSLYYRGVAPALAEVRSELAKQKKIEEELKNEIPTTLVMKEREKPRETHVHVRGNFLNKGEQVAAGVPAALHPWPEGEPTNRVTLAKWLMSKENPLTARVLANRIWSEYFGIGIVETLEDFGTQGAKPAHPELLDWLALEFMESGWDLKKLHTTIVTSATYRQSSRFRPDLHEKDPANRLFARGPRFRVPAENVRDIALAASGLLKPRIGGPSVYPPQPEGIWTQIYGSEKWNISAGEDRYRRGLYTYIKRTSPYPMFLSFDAPSREYSCARRPKTNTPLQALTTLNDPAFVEAAQVMARKVSLQLGPEPRARIVNAFRRCVARAPSDREVERLLELYEQELQTYRADEKAAAAMAFGEGAKPLEGFDLPDLAAMTVVANVLLNLDETLCK